MFRLPGVRGIVVENALPELYEDTVDIPTYTSRQILADGVLDGLCHYGVIGVLPTKEKTRVTRDPDDGPGLRQMLFTGTKLGSLSDKEKSVPRHRLREGPARPAEEHHAPRLLCVFAHRQHHHGHRRELPQRLGPRRRHHRLEHPATRGRRHLAAASARPSRPCSTPPRPTGRFRPTSASTMAHRTIPAWAALLPSTAACG